MITILSINNKEDIKEMMQYHRTKDMINLIAYFPELSPIKDLTIVKSLEDYKNNYEYCNSLCCVRNDTLVTKPSMKSVEKSKQDKDFTKVFKKIKDIDSDGVLVLFNLSHNPSERYERYAGISVGVSLDNGVYIDAVGKGFDGREVSKGISIHEQYYIPWFDLRKCNIKNFKNYRTYLISNFEYQKSRKERISFLTSTGLQEEKISKSIPINYEEIPDFIWDDVIKNLLKKLDKTEEILKMSGFTEFAISGHTEGKQFLPWQIFDKSRYQLTKKQD